MSNGSLFVFHLSLVYIMVKLQMQYFPFCTCNYPGGKASRYKFNCCLDFQCPNQVLKTRYLFYAVPSFGVCMQSENSFYLTFSV